MNGFFCFYYYEWNAPPPPPPNCPFLYLPWYSHHGWLGVGWLGVKKTLQVSYFLPTVFRRFHSIETFFPHTTVKWIGTASVTGACRHCGLLQDNGSNKWPILDFLYIFWEAEPSLLLSITVSVCTSLLEFRCICVPDLECQTGASGIVTSSFGQLCIRPKNKTPVLSSEWLFFLRISVVIVLFIICRAPKSFVCYRFVPVCLVRLVQIVTVTKLSKSGNFQSSLSAFLCTCMLISRGAFVRGIAIGCYKTYTCVSRASISFCVCSPAATF